MTPVGPTSEFDSLGSACPVGTAKPATIPRNSVAIHLLIRRGPLAEDHGKIAR